MAINACENGDVQQSSAIEIFEFGGNNRRIDCWRYITISCSRRRIVVADGIVGGKDAERALWIRL